MLIPVNTMLLKSDMFWRVDFNPFHFHSFLSLYLISLPGSGIHVLFPPLPRLVVLTTLLSHKYKWTRVDGLLYICFLQFYLSYPNFYYSFSFSASQSINLCTFTMTVWLCPRCQSSNVASHPSHVYFVILSSLKGWSKSCRDSWSIDDHMCRYKIVWASHTGDANTSTNTLQRRWGAWWWFRELKRKCPHGPSFFLLQTSLSLAFDVSLNCSISIFWDNLPFKGVEFQVGNSLAQCWWANHLHYLS